MAFLTRYVDDDTRPTIGEALRDNDAARAQHEAAELAMRVRAAAARVDQATAALR